MKNSTLISVSLAICTILTAAMFFVGNFIQPTEVIKTDTVFSTHTDTLWKDTTIFQDKIKEKIVEKIKVDTLFKENGDTVQLTTEAKTFEKSIISDKDTADLKIYTSGINTALDSLKMRLKTHKEVITNTVEVTKYVQKKKTFIDRFHIGLQGGYGYAFKSKELTPYVGVGVGFDL